MRLVSNAALLGIGISIGIAIGIGIAFGVFASSTSDVERLIEQQDAKIAVLESELKSANKKIDTLQVSQQQNMQAMMQMMMQNPETMKQMIDTMTNNPDFMQSMMQAMRGSQMMGPMDPRMGSSMMEEMPFNPAAPITIPMIDGYYDGKRVFFIHTEVSDKGMADMMSRMVNFPTLHVPELKNISEENLAKVYVFTNGIPGSGPYGGGPFMFQIDIFDSIPGQEAYSQFRVPHLVTWKDGATPRVLTSAEDLLTAGANGELTIQKIDNVVNAPMIVWPGQSGENQLASRIQRIFLSMPDFEGEVVNVDIDNYIGTLRLNSMR